MAGSEFDDTASERIAQFSWVKQSKRLGSMGYTFDEVLGDELVDVVDRNDEMGEFVVRIGSLETLVTIELGRFMNSEQTKFTLSHVIKTPLQAGPYRTSLPFGDDPGYALHRAIDGLTSWYEKAVEEGHEPSEDWLVPY